MKQLTNLAKPRKGQQHKAPEHKQAAPLRLPKPDMGMPIRKGL